MYLIPRAAVRYFAPALLCPFSLFPQNSPLPTAQALSPALPALTLRFERGAEPNSFAAQASGYRAAISPTGFRMAMSHSGITRLVSVSVRNANPAAHGEARDLLPGRIAYLRGESAQWRESVPAFRQVRYTGVLDGVDMLYRGKAGNLEFDFIVHEGADPARIALRFQGQDELTVDSEGNLIALAGGERFVQKAPAVYQHDGDSLRLIAAAYAIRANGDVGFELGEYDRGKTLIIDPVVVYSGFTGGNGTDKAVSIVRDSKGFIYVAGNTGSTNLTASENSIQNFRAGDQDLFVMKINPYAPPDEALQYLTYLGGTGAEELAAMAVDDSGHVYLAGTTGSTDFPTTGAAQQASAAGDKDGFVVKLDFSENAASAAVYSTYLGGSGPDVVYGLAVGLDGSAYVVGYTGSTNFPVVGAALQSASNGGWDGFVTKIDAGGTIAYSTYFGGDKTDSARAIAIAPDGAVVVALNTISTSIPAAGEAYTAAYRGGGDIFIARFSMDGGGLTYGSYLGGSALDSAAQIGFDSRGRLVITGSTQSTDFPITLGAIQAQNGGGTDAFLSVLDVTKGAAGLVYSTYLGGKGTDTATALKIGGNDQAVVVGFTTSAEFPVTTTAMQDKSGGLTDAFVVELDLTAPPAGALAYSTYLGGAQNDYAYGVETDLAGTIYVAGNTSSRKFPASSTVDRGSYPGDYDAFVFAFQPCGFTLSPGGVKVPAEGGAGSFLVNGGQDCGWSAVSGSEWISIGQANAAGRGNGEVAYTVAANTLSAGRAGSVRVGNQSHTVAQAGVECSITIDPSEAAVGADGGAVTIAVRANAPDCAWTSASTESWLSVKTGDTGKGDGSVSFSIAANEGADSRSAFVVAAGRSLKVTQSGAGPK